jgi:threonine dehydrogenase-like Zn-dependent dehydrogenase
MWDRSRVEHTAVRLLERGKLVTAPMIGRRFRYADAAEAYRFIDEHPEQTLKTLLDYEESPR